MAIFGLISAVLVGISGIPYAVRTYQGKIRPNLTSWTLWSIISLALLLTYRSSGAKANIWPAVISLISTFLITILAVRRQGKLSRPKTVEIFCFALGIISLGLWIAFRNEKNLAQYVLYLAILADICAAVPTVIFVWITPDGDRPFAWGMFAIGYGLAILAVSEHTFANYALPVYMLLGASSTAYPLARYRWRKKLPIWEWI